MAGIVFQSLEGLEAGRIYDELEPPLTIGREEDNDIQLNDERVSRFHAKVQSDGEKFILTDLDSTNGTRVNGHVISMRVLRPGDLVMIGRCILLMATDEDPPESLSFSRPIPPGDPDESSDPVLENDVPVLEEAFPQGPPSPPSSLNVRQAAEVSDMLEYIRTEILQVLCSPIDDDAKSDPVKVQRAAWSRLQKLVGRMNAYADAVTSPTGE